MKRKDVEDLYNDFSSISLCSSPRKSRRLDADLLPVINGDQSVGEDQPLTSNAMVDADVPCIDPVVSSNDSVERSLVLYNPANTQFVKSPSSPEFSIIVNSDLIPGLKDRILWWGTSRSVKSGEDEINSDNTENLKDCLAIVPWVDIQSPGASRYEESTGLVELTEAEEVEMMDMDDRNVSSNEKEFSEMVEGRELQLWQQQHQHCMKPNLPANPSTPVTW